MCFVNYDVKQNFHYYCNTITDCIFSRTGGFRMWEDGQIDNNSFVDGI